MPCLRYLLLLSVGLFACVAVEARQLLPPRSEWRASSSSVETPAIASSKAIDGDQTTRWGGAFTAGQWFQVDLGRAAAVSGILIRWDSGFAASYLIQSSVDGTQWRTAFETTDGPGDIDYVFFSTVQARYLRLTSVPRTADWSVSMFEFEPLSPEDVPRVVGIGGQSNNASVWSPGVARAITARGKSGTREVSIRLPRPLPLAGLDVTWGSARTAAQLDARNGNGTWRTLAEDPDALGDASFLAAREPFEASELRLTVTGAGTEVPAIRRLRLLSPSRVMTPLKRYEIAASRANKALFPDTLHRQQVYWTAIGIPGGKQKSIFDEYGNLEPFKSAPLVQPVWRDASGRTVAAANAPRTQALREGWMPIPSVEWSPQPGLLIRSEAFAIEQAGSPVTLVRHRLRNSGTAPVQGQLSLVLRPLQVNPQWQHGGVSPIREVAIEGDPAQSSVRVNGRVLLHSLTPVSSRGAAGFGHHGENEITRHVASGSVPSGLTARDDDGLAAALLNYKVSLAAGAQSDVVIAFPLGAERVDTQADTLPDSPALDRSAFTGSADDPAGFDSMTAIVARQWQSRLGTINVSLPDRSLVDMLRAQAAYMLINQTGHAMQPGPRNYNRSFIRDGSATAAVLLRMGMAQTTRDYLRWYTDHAVHKNGLVSPIINEDGSVNRGFGSDNEHDSQGQFIWLVAEVARLDGGAVTVRDYEPKVRAAMRFMQELRERTLVPGYLADREAPARFRGIIAPSISHEGYSTPTHSYWDDYWALKGWHDGAWLADQWGDKALASWARAQHSALRDSLAASIKATMAWKGIDYMPASADLADSDPTSVSIALDPCGAQDVLPADVLQRTFARYLETVRERALPDSLYAYTPYELRNVLTYVHLNQPQHASELLTILMKDRRPQHWQVYAEVVHSRERYDRYLGDMPHTWIGAEYARLLFGMLMREGDQRLHLLPGTPPAWLRKDGLSVRGLPTAYGTLSMAARQSGTTLKVTLESGLRADTRLQVAWPDRSRPARVSIDGKIATDYTADGISISGPFNELTAQW